MEKSPFGRLPAELRNIIYQDALYVPNGVELRTEPGLLGTCKSIRAEAELMFYAINDFVFHVHEDYMNHDLCRWLKMKAGPRLRLIQQLAIHCDMPSIGTKASRPESTTEDDSHIVGFLQLMHLMDSIRQTSFQKNLASLVRFTLNDAKDDVSLETLEHMSLEDQDRYRGAKFLIVCLVHGEQAVMDALDDDNAGEDLERLDQEIEACRVLDRAANRGG